MKKGFSLIELLVVMVIIGILAGIGIAQFKSQQEKSIEAKLAAECSLAQRCEDIVNSCLKGGESGCDNLCDATDISCKIKYKGGSNDNNFLNISNGVIAGGPQELFTTSNWVRAWSHDPVFKLGEDGHIEFRVLNSRPYFNTGLRRYQSSDFRADSYHYGIVFNGLDYPEARHNSPAGMVPYSPTDVFRIQKTGSKILFKKNGSVMYNYSIADQDLYFVLSSRFAGQQLGDVKILQY